MDAAEAAAEVELGVTSGVSHAWRALRHRNFRLFFGGQTISLIGTWMTRVATGWLVYRLTGSALLLGTVSFAGPDSHLSSCALCRRLGRPARPPAGAGVDPDFIHGPVAGAGSVDALGPHHHSPVAHVERDARLHQCLRHARPGTPGPDRRRWSRPPVPLQGVLGVGNRPVPHLVTNSQALLEQVRVSLQGEAAGPAVPQKTRSG